EEETGADGRTGTGHPGNQCEGLGQADGHAVTNPEVPEAFASVANPLGGQQHETEEDQSRRDQAEVPSSGLDLILEQQAEDPDRDRGDYEIPTHAGIGVPSSLGITQTSQPGEAYAPQISPEVKDDGEHRAQLDHRGERRSGIVPSEQLGDDAQMTAGGHGQ